MIHLGYHAEMLQAFDFVGLKVWGLGVQGLCSFGLAASDSGFQAGFGLSAVRCMRKVLVVYGLRVYPRP